MICEIENKITVRGHNEDVGLGVNNFIGSEVRNIACVEELWVWHIKTKRRDLCIHKKGRKV